jgi:hypothetical protein
MPTEITASIGAWQCSQARSMHNCWRRRCHSSHTRRSQGRQLRVPTAAGEPCFRR